MSTPEPLSAENCTNQYDDDELKPPDPAAVIEWAEALERLSAARTYWFATLHPGGRPHVRPVLAVWVRGLLVTTSSPGTRKFRNVVSNDQVTLTTSTDGIDFVVEGFAAPVAGAEILELVAAAYRSKYGWPVAVAGDALHAPYGAPAAGPPPYQPLAVTARTVYGFGTDERLAPRSTRWRFAAAPGGVADRRSHGSEGSGSSR